MDEISASITHAGELFPGPAQAVAVVLSAVIFVVKLGDRPFLTVCKHSPQFGLASHRRCCSVCACMREIPSSCVVVIRYRRCLAGGVPRASPQCTSGAAHTVSRKTRFPRDGEAHIFALLRPRWLMDEIACLLARSSLVHGCPRLHSSLMMVADGRQ